MPVSSSTTATKTTGLRAGPSASASNSSFLAPEDAYYHGTPGDSAWKRKDRGRSASHRRKATYKKLLWFKQPFPDNYTDEQTFLDHLQRNPRTQPYEFWYLMAASTVIVQHVASVVIFCCAFTGIFQERVSPISVVSWASFCSFLAWLVWDYWMGHEEASRIKETGDESHELNTDAPAHQPPFVDPDSSLSPRNQQRLATVKSAMLIYAAVLGLSPILKSLTRSTTSDSIWAITAGLLALNIACFDYSTSNRSSLPASFSTNSAVMASTVLASRLPSTTHVFSLTLFSIEVFGLFPIFRRKLRIQSWNGHLALTIFLVTIASGALFTVLTGGGRGAWIAGMFLGSMMTFFGMGVCTWWLIGLQKYKNEIHGPWDPARPVIRRRWD
ncbi:unnamed protein product [Periconia digitata]|uniref:Phosphatidylinositol N-acetylglucosaminyltransferase n=1 Tax=Periconia digitata TaxID=1303443 RepID=A0A9W4UK67_9PLEO|nr:unnamed protein product [Periconia digitata]